MLSPFTPQSNTHTSLPASKQGSGVRPRKAMRSYSSQREQLHKTRSRTSSTEAAVQRGRSCDITLGHVTWGDAFPSAESLRKNLSQPPVEVGEGGKMDRVISEAIAGQTVSIEVCSAVVSLTVWCMYPPLALVCDVECE